MTTKELIKILKELDPLGNLRVILNEETTHFRVEKAEGYSLPDNKDDDSITEEYIYIEQ